jgi:aminopeptidase-like protein
MKSYPSLKSLLGEILTLHRTLASDDMEKTYQILGSYLPDAANYAVEIYAPGEQVWTWRVPEKYIVHEAYLETSHQRVIDFQNNPLHIISYSLPVDLTLNWDELQPHLRYNEKRPGAIPWEFKFYERDWGFCLSKDQFDELPRGEKYRAVIRSEFEIDPARGGFRVASALVHPAGGENPRAGEFIVMSHTCHPNQANDNTSGVVVEMELARRFAENPLPAGSMSLRFWFGPETIGTVAYLAHHEDLIPNLRGGMFIDSVGNDNTLAFQHTRQHDHLLDRVAHYVMQKRFEEFRQAEFPQLAPNDERVINGPGVNVPCMALTRFPYPEYHTSDDNLDIIHEDLLIEAADVAEEIIRIYASNYIPKRTFRGPVFLSGNGLWVDWRENWALNRAIEKIMMSFEGKDSIFDIAEQVNIDYWTVREYVEKFRAQGFVIPLAIPSEAQTA